MFIAVVIVLGVAGAVLFGIYYGWRAIITAITIPRGHRRIGEFEHTRGCKELRKDGYAVTPDWSSNAMKTLKSKR
jgi:hypothetical protein